MTFYHNDTRLGFLSEKFVRDALKRCEEIVLVVHLHQQMSLLEKSRKHFEEIRGGMLADTTVLYTQFENKLPHSNDSSKDKMIYLNVARHFLLTSNAAVLYYGRFITEGIDSYIAEAFTNNQQKKKKKARDTRI